SLLVFILLLTLGAIFAGIVAPPLVALYNPDPATLAQLRASAAGLPKPEAAAAAGLSEWIVALVPANPLRAATSEALLQVIVFTVLFALAITRLADEQREALRAFFLALNETMHVLVGWVIRLIPMGVFALAPAQAVAAGSRSSLASLPAMIAGADRWLGLSHTSFVLPLAVATLRVSQPVHQLTKLFFMAHLYGVELRPADVVIFTVMVSVISLGIAGLPGTGTVKSIPVYLAAGIPLEGILVFNAIDAIPDIFRTLGNVTGDMTALTLVAHLASPENNHTKTLDQPLHDVG
ncbi:MAG: dicarboxylate/amino acid:cation symporter, partial [Blastocatellia bacterium]